MFQLSWPIQIVDPSAGSSVLAFFAAAFSSASASSSLRFLGGSSALDSSVSSESESELSEESSDYGIVST